MGLKKRRGLMPPTKYDFRALREYQQEAGKEWNDLTEEDYERFVLPSFDESQLLPWIIYGVKAVDKYVFWAKFGDGTEIEYDMKFFGGQALFENNPGLFEQIEVAYDGYEIRWGERADLSAYAIKFCGTELNVFLKLRRKMIKFFRKK